MPSKIVVFLLGHNVFATADVLRGIAAVADANHITLTPVDSLLVSDDAAVNPAHASALILGRADPVQVKRAKDLQKPAVVLFDHDAARTLPAVLPDELQIGRLAAEHLSSRGFRHLGFVGSTARWSELRLAGFAAAAARTHARVLPPRLESSWAQLRDTAAMARWLADKPKPLGLLAANDEIAVVARDAAASLGLRIPEDVAILGVDNNEFRSRYGQVPLSSVDVDAERIGRTALELLLPCLNGAHDPPPTGVHLVPPAGIVARRSTNLLAIADPDVRSAVQFIAEHACQGIDVSDVLAKLLISRSALDRRMKAAIGRTCAEEIARVRLAHATRLLKETDYPLSHIASACGYHYLSHFSHAFRQATGIPPSRFRRAQRSPRNPTP